MSIPLPINDYHNRLVLNSTSVTTLKTKDVYSMVSRATKSENEINFSWVWKLKVALRVKISIRRWVGDAWFAKTCFYL